MFFSVASWHVLADGYARPSYDRRTPEALLDPAWRVPAVVRHAELFAADVLCLQEVERPVLDALTARLGPLGYGLSRSRRPTVRRDRPVAPAG